MGLAIVRTPTYRDPIWFGKYRIYSDTSAPYRYAFQHDDFDGAEDANDNRYGYANTVEACCEEIEEIEGGIQ